MAVENDKVNEIFAMDGVLLVFSVTGMRVTDRATIKAYTIDNTDPLSPVKTDLVLDTDYTVAIVTENSFNVTVIDAETSDFELVVYRELELLQASDYTDYGKFPAETVEDDFDIGILIDQQIADASNRSMKLDIDIDLNVVSVLLPSPSASELLGWNAAATALVNYTPNTSAYLTKATQSEAEAGTDNDAYMTPLRTAEAIAAQGGGGVAEDITQATHGFVVGDVLKLSGTTYAKAQADSEANAEVVGMVSAVADVNTFTLTQSGNIAGLSGLTAGDDYYLDPATAGAITATEPTATGEVSKPVLIADTTTSGWFFATMRGTVINGGTGPNQVVQVVNLTTGSLVTGIGQMGTGNWTSDDSIPQSSEGYEVMTLAITPNSASNKLLILVKTCHSVNGSTYTGSTLFLDAETDARAFTWDVVGASANQTFQRYIMYYMTAGTTSAMTFKVRIGTSTSITSRLNGGASDLRVGGGSMNSGITIQEISV